MNQAARERLQAWYAGLAPREQLIVRVGALAGALLLVVGLVLRLHGVVQAAEQRLAAKRADAAYIQGLFAGLGVGNNGLNILTNNGVVVTPAEDFSPDGGLNRSQVVQDFLNSDQSLLRTVNAYYYAYLQRSVDPVPAVPFWATTLRSSGSLETAAVGVLDSAEYFAKVQRRG